MSKEKQGKSSFDKRNLRKDKPKSHWELYVKDTKFQKSKDVNVTDSSDEDKTPIQSDNEDSDEIDSEIEKEKDPFSRKDLISYSPVNSPKIPENIVRSPIVVTSFTKKTGATANIEIPKNFDFEIPEIGAESLEFQKTKEILEQSGVHESKNTNNFVIKASYSLFDDNNCVKTENFDYPINSDQIEFCKDIVQSQLTEFLIPDRVNIEPLQRRVSDWSLDLEMANQMPIKDITALIKDYDGNEEGFDSYIRNIDKLWQYIQAYTAEDKARFMLVLQLKLIEKAAEATKDIEFDEWTNVKIALKEELNPQKNIEKAELKLQAISQNSSEDVETYAKRVEKLLNELNRCFAADHNATIASDNDRKARRAFENGLRDSELRSRAIARSNDNFKAAVDYVVEQELRSPRNKFKMNEKSCSFCKIRGHTLQECRKKNFSSFENRRFSTNSNVKQEITCYKCNKKGHYASECRSNGNNNNNNAPSTSKGRSSINMKRISPNTPEKSPRKGPFNVSFYAKNEMPLREAVNQTEENTEKN